MMHEFLAVNRQELVERCRSKVALRPSPNAADDEELDHGITLFLDQLIRTLKIEETSEPLKSREVSGASGGLGSSWSNIGESAALHGRELLQRGFTIEQVVHDYGDLCQAITDLASDREFPIEIDEFRTLNRCLDNAIAGAVTEYNYQRDLVVSDKQAEDLNQKLGYFAHELRNLLRTATLALTAIRAGKVGLSGTTGDVLDVSLVGMRNLIDRSLTEVRMAAGIPPQPRLFSLADFIADVKLSALLEANIEQCEFKVAEVDRRLAVEADRDLLFSAVGNLLQNAFKFTHPHSEVSLKAYAKADRISIDIEDSCGGLPEGDVENLFRPFIQGEDSKIGLGLGLFISRRSVEANKGELRVRDVPGSGCVFTIDLPRHDMPSAIFRN
jgi:signal transduction histidine kinase